MSKILEVPKGKLYSNEQLIFDYNADKELAPPLKDISLTLINELSENKKLLLIVKSNQEQLQQQLGILLKAFNN